MDADLRAGHDPEAVFEADLGAGIEAEEVRSEVAEIAGAERPSEPVRHAKRAGEAGYLQRRGQADDREVRL
jgi:hypothetical protein